MESIISTCWENKTAVIKKICEYPYPLYVNEFLITSWDTISFENEVQIYSKINANSLFPSETEYSHFSNYCKSWETPSIKIDTQFVSYLPLWNTQLNTNLFSTALKLPSWSKQEIAFDSSSDTTNVIFISIQTDKFNTKEFNELKQQEKEAMRAAEEGSKIKVFTFYVTKDPELIAKKFLSNQINKDNSYIIPLDASGSNPFSESDLKYWCTNNNIILLKGNVIKYYSLSQSFGLKHLKKAVLKISQHESISHKKIMFEEYNIESQSWVANNTEQALQGILSIQNEVSKIDIMSNSKQNHINLNMNHEYISNIRIVTDYKNTESLWFDWNNKTVQINYTLSLTSSNNEDVTRIGSMLQAWKQQFPSIQQCCYWYYYDNNNYKDWPGLMSTESTTCSKCKVKAITNTVPFFLCYVCHSINKSKVYVCDSCFKFSETHEHPLIFVPPNCDTGKMVEFNGCQEACEDSLVGAKCSSCKKKIKNEIFKCCSCQEEEDKPYVLCKACFVVYTKDILHYEINEASNVENVNHEKYHSMLYYQDKWKCQKFKEFKYE